MSFTDQKPRIATEADVKSPWSGGREGKYFRCKICGHKFVVGDYYRFVFHNYGNIIVCQDCDKGDPVAKWTQIHEEWSRLKEGKFWWFACQLEDGLRETEREATLAERESRADVEYWKNKALYEGTGRERDQ
jgi:hypothetical protein